MMGMVVGGGSASAVFFNGAYLSRGSAFTGAVDSGKWTLSLWFKPSAAAIQMLLASSVPSTTNTPGFTVQLGSDGRVSLRGRSGGNAIRVGYNSAGAATVGQWNHFLISFDLSSSTLRSAYFNGAADAGTWSNYAGGNISFTTDAAVAAWIIAGSPDQQYTGSLAYLFHAPDQYIDLSVASNRQKFISNGRPGSAGASASSYAGTAPILYLAGDADAFAVNKGTGGGMTASGPLYSGGQVALP